MLTGEYAILVMGPPYYKDVCFFLYKEAHFYACSLLFSSSLRNPWDKPHRQRLPDLVGSLGPRSGNAGTLVRNKRHGLCVPPCHAWRSPRPAVPVYVQAAMRTSRSS